MDTTYYVRFTGRLHIGLNQEDVIANLVKLTNLSREKAESLFSSGKPLILKKDLNLATAEKYRKVFERAGMMIQIVKTDVSASTDPAAEEPKPGQSPKPLQALSPSPKASQTPLEKKISAENPYAAPRADLKVKKETNGTWTDQPQKVPASHGWHWLKSAFSMFFERPWVWMGMSLIIFVMTIILSLVPIVGSLCSFLLMAILSGGLMLAAQAQINGEKVTVGNIFKGFSHNPGQLLLVGLFYLLFAISIGLLVGGTIVGVIFSQFHSANMANLPIFLQTHIPLIIILILLSLFLSVPLVMAYWFAPSLVVLTDKSAWKAYKLSFRGCRKNWAPFLIYGLAVLVIGILLMLAISALTGILFVFISRNGSFLMAFLPMIIYALLGIPVASIMGLTIFTGFRDIFYQPS